MTVNLDKVLRALESLQRRVPQDCGLETVPWASVQEQAKKLFEQKLHLSIRQCLDHLNVDELEMIFIQGVKLLDPPTPKPDILKITDQVLSVPKHDSERRRPITNTKKQSSSITK